MLFHNPWLLLLLLLLPLVAYFTLRRRSRAQIQFSRLSELDRAGVSWRQRLGWLLPLVRWICVAVLIVALARPQKGNKFSDTKTKGVAMELVMDLSASMVMNRMEYDGQVQTRLAVVKKVLADFVDDGGKLPGRPDDLLGFITFAGTANTRCPLVHSRQALLDFIRKVDYVPVNDPDAGTAIGDAVALAVARLDDAEKNIKQRNQKLKARALAQGKTEREVKPDFEIRSKVIVLLTDGENNRGQLLPMQAADLAKEKSIKIYTIGIGNRRTMSGRAITELNGMAEASGGVFGRADDGEALLKLCDKINKLEKTDINAIEYSRYDEKFAVWAWIAFGLMIFEIVASHTLFRRIP